MPTVLLGLGLLYLGAADRPAAQQVAAYPLEGLRFGELSAGIPTQVRPSSVTGSAEIEILGEGPIVVMFVLPESLVSDRGHAIPLVFGPRDGVLRLDGRGDDVYFDPRIPLEISIPQSRISRRPGGDGATIFLGGSALPAVGQHSGPYSATIILHVIKPGT